jgi:hypothetical protein
MHKEEVLSGRVTPSGTVYADASGNWWTCKWGGPLYKVSTKAEALEHFWPEKSILVSAPLLFPVNVA